MSYPPPPWNLLGHGVQSIHTVPIADVRPWVPPELDIVSVWPGKTCGVIAFAHYGPGSILEYDELIIAPAVVKHQGRYGVWISHIYVSHPDSVQGGREIWGVPKLLARFQWTSNGHSRTASATLDGNELCSLTTGRSLTLWTQHLDFPSYSQLAGDLLRFTGVTRSKVCLTRAAADVPRTSPFAGIRFSHPWLAARLEPMELVCTAPEVVGQTSLVRSPDPQRAPVA